MPIQVKTPLANSPPRGRYSRSYSRKSTTGRQITSRALTCRLASTSSKVETTATSCRRATAIACQRPSLTTASRLLWAENTQPRLRVSKTSPAISSAISLSSTSSTPRAHATCAYSVTRELRVCWRVRLLSQASAL